MCRCVSPAVRVDAGSIAAGAAGGNHRRVLCRHRCGNLEQKSDIEPADTNKRLKDQITGVKR